MEHRICKLRVQNLHFWRILLTTLIVTDNIHRHALHMTRAHNTVMLSAYR